MSDDKTFLLEIAPIGEYFFGGERTFQSVENDKDGNPVTNYFARSNNYPQQTAILGMIRHVLLLLYGKLDATPAEKEEIIGKNFSVYKDSPFGKIVSLSPLVILHNHGKNILFPAGLDKQKYNGFKGFNLEMTQGSVYLNRHSNLVPDLNNFNYKKELRNCWQDSEMCVHEEDLFENSTRVGVHTDRSANGFYKQTFKAIKKGFSFGVWVTFAVDFLPEKLTDIVMPFGADQGLSQLRFHTNVALPGIFTESAVFNPTKMILLSDAYVDNDFFDAFDYGITVSEEFRYIDSARANFYKMDSSGFSKSSKLRLLKRGSVLYFSDFAKVKQVLSRFNSSFKRIGYNYYNFNYTRRHK